MIVIMVVAVVSCCPGCRGRRCGRRRCCRRRCCRCRRRGHSVVGGGVRCSVAVVAIAAVVALL